MDTLYGFSLSDAINVGLLLVAIVGIFLTYKEINQSRITQKATFFKDLYSTFFSDKEIRQAFYQIEQDTFEFELEFYGTENEKLMDRLLSFVDLVTDLYDQKIITPHEMNFFKYQLMRIYQNKNVKGYLRYLTAFYKYKGVDSVPFPSYVSYCEENLDYFQNDSKGGENVVQEETKGNLK